MKSHILGAGQFVELILTHEKNDAWNGDDVNCGDKNLNEDNRLKRIKFITFFSLNFEAKQNDYYSYYD